MSCNKRAYWTEDLAVEALVEARIRFDNNSATNVYLCDECRNWHLTSQGVLHPRLATMIKSGGLKRQKEAHHWERKLK